MGDLINTGKLSPQEADAFIDLLVENTPLLQLMTFIKADRMKGAYPAIGAGQYNTQAFTSAMNAEGGRYTAAEVDDAGGSIVEYDLKELVLTRFVPYSFFEDTKTDTEKVAEMLAKEFGQDLQYLFLNGDTDTIGTTRKQKLTKAMNGIVKQLTANGLTCPWAAGDTTIVKKLDKLVAGATDNILASTNLKIFISPLDYTALWQDVQNNNKTLMVSNGKVYYRGKMEFVEVATLPEGRPIIGDMANFLGSVGRDISIDKETNAARRGILFVISCRADATQYPNANLRVLAASAT